MIALDRKSILEGILELQKEEELENKKALNTIKYIINKRDISDFEKLKHINEELSKLLLAAI